MHSAHGHKICCEHFWWRESLVCHIGFDWKWLFAVNISVIERARTHKHTCLPNVCVLCVYVRSKQRALESGIASNERVYFRFSECKRCIFWSTVALFMCAPMLWCKQHYSICSRWTYLTLFLYQSPLACVSVCVCMFVVFTFTSVVLHILETKL